MVDRTSELDEVRREGRRLRRRQRSDLGSAVVALLGVALVEQRFGGLEAHPKPIQLILVALVVIAIVSICSFIGKLGEEARVVLRIAELDRGGSPSGPVLRAFRLLAWIDGSRLESWSALLGRPEKTTSGPGETSPHDGAVR